MKIDPRKTAVLSLDIQQGILGFVPGAEAILPNAAKVVETARKGGFYCCTWGSALSRVIPR